MKKIRILFYKARIGDKHWLDDAISLWTGLFNWGTGPYSHVELWVPREHDTNPFESPEFTVRGKGLHKNKFGDCYTSTMRGDAKGVCKRPASETLKHSERWDYCEIEIDDTNYDRLIGVADMAVKTNQGYDTKAIASFFWYKRIHNPLKYICSEFVYYLLLACFVLKIRSNACPSPRRLSRWLTKRGYKIKPLQE